MKRWKYSRNYSLKMLKTIKIGDMIYFADDPDKALFKHNPDEIVLSIDKTYKTNCSIFKIFTNNKEVFYRIVCHYCNTGCLCDSSLLKEA